MKEPFVGSEALRCGSFSRHQLRTRYRAVFPDVYVSNDAVPSLDLQTQLPVLGGDGLPFAYLDLGWDEAMVAVEYDGDQHRTDRRQYVKDVRRLERLERMGWIVVRVVAEDHPADVVRRVRAALVASSVRSGL